MKKIIAILICILMSATVFQTCVTADAQDAQNAEYTGYAEEEGLLIELGVIADNYRTQGPLTRAQFIKSVVNVLPVEFDLSEEYERFIDVPSNHEAYMYVNKAYEMGYISGYGGMFYPDRKISFEDASVIFCKIMGLDYYAKALNGYPYGYYNAAKKFGIFKGLKTDRGNEVTYQDTVKMLYNLLNAPLVQNLKTPDSDIVVDVKKDETFLGSYYSVYRAEGTLETAGNSSVKYDSNCSENTITIDGVSYNTDKDYLDYLGMDVVAYYKYDVKKRTNDIIFMAVTKNNSIIEIEISDIIDFKNHKIRYADDQNKIKNAVVSEWVNVVYNGRFAPDFRLEDIKNLYAGTIKLISANKSKYDLAIITEHRSAIVKSVDIISSTIFFEDKTFFGSEKKSLALDEYTVQDYQGIDMKITDIKKGYLVSVVSDINNEMVKILVGNNKLSGITNYNDKEVFSGEETYKIGKEFDYSKNPSEFSSNYEYYIDYFNEVVAVDDSYDNNNEYYGYVISHKKGTALDDSDIMIRVYEETGEFKAYQFAKKLSINNVSGQSRREILTSSLFDTSTNSIKPQMIKYKKSNNTIFEIEMAEDCTNEDGYIGYKEEKFTKDAVFSSATLQYASKVLAGKYFLSSGAKIFMIPADKTDEDKYDIADVGIYTGSIQLSNIEIYDADRFRNAGVIVVEPASREYSIDPLVVTRVSAYSDDEGNDRIKLTGYIGGVKGEYTLADNLDSTNTISVGDVLAVSLMDFQIKQFRFMSKIQDRDIDVAPYDIFNTTNTSAKWVALRGEVDDTGDQMLRVTINSELSPFAYPLSNSGVIYNCYTDRDIIEPGEFADIYKGARVFIHRYFDGVNLVLIYR